MESNTVHKQPHDKTSESLGMLKVNSGSYCHYYLNETGIQSTEMFEYFDGRILNFDLEFWFDSSFVSGIKSDNIDTPKHQGWG